MQQPSTHNDKQDLLFTGLLGLSWVACAVLINPIGDFPLNDDWAFGSPVEILYKDRALRFTDWQSPTLVAQVFWGLIFCLPAGFSFTALRISSLTAGLLGLIGLYFLLRHLGANRGIAMCGTAVLAFNPFFLCLAYSFMTDVPYLSVMILAMHFLLRGVDLDHRGQLALGLALACLSSFIRQIGLVILVAFLFAYPIRRGFGKRWMLVAVIPTVVCAALLWSFERYLDLIGETPGLFTVKSAAIKEFWTDVAHGRLGAFKASLNCSVNLLMYLGLWSLPFSLLIAPRVLARLAPARRNAVWLLLAGVTAGLSTLLARRGSLMPMVKNQLNKYGMGIMTLPGAQSELPRSFWIAVTALAVAGAALLIVILGELVREKWLSRSKAPEHEKWLWHVIFLLAVGVLNLGPIAFAYGAVFDRYFLVFLPVLLGLFVALCSGRSIIPGRLAGLLSASLMAVYLIFGVAATHDYLAWNRARWAAAGELHERFGVPEEEIDGGFEYNNLLDSRKRFRTRWIHRPGVVEMIENPSRPYRLALSPLASFEVLSLVEARPWLPQGMQRVYCLRRLSTERPKATPAPDTLDHD